MDADNTEDLSHLSVEERAKARVVGAGPYNVPMEFPFKYDMKIQGGAPREEEVTSVTIRRPGMKEITDATDTMRRKNDSSATYTLMSQLTGLPVNALHKMDPADYVEVEAIIGVFTEKLQKIGKQSSET